MARSLSRVSVLQRDVQNRSEPGADQVRGCRSWPASRAKRLDRHLCCGLTSLRCCFQQKTYFQYLEYLGFVLRDNSLKQLESVFSSYIDVDNGTIARYVIRLKSTSLRGAYCVAPWCPVRWLTVLTDNCSSRSTLPTGSPTFSSSSCCPFGCSWLSWVSNGRRLDSSPFQRMMPTRWNSRTLRCSCGVVDESRRKQDLSRTWLQTTCSSGPASLLPVPSQNHTRPLV